MKDMFAVFVRFALLPVLLLITLFAFVIHLGDVLLEVLHELLDIIQDFFESTLVMLADFVRWMDGKLPKVDKLEKEGEDE